MVRLFYYLKFNPTSHKVRWLKLTGTLASFNTAF
jgi:hypothetical protein